MTFTDLQNRVIALVRERVQNGEWTERGFARSIHISQSHIHNVLKGRRSLSIKNTDLILEVGHHSVLDLLRVEEISDQLVIISERSVPRVEIPFLTGPLGPGVCWPGKVNGPDCYAVPCIAVNPEGGAVLVRLAEDREMVYGSLGYNIAVLERMGKDLSPDSTYAIDRGGETVLRHVRTGIKALYLVTDTNLDRPARWEPVRLPVPSGLLRGRVRWWGREKAGRAPRSA